MRYSKDSYLEVEEEQAAKFFAVVAAIRREINVGSTKGKSYNDFIRAGVNKETMAMLKASHFITWHDKTEAVWISWKNEIYDDRTIDSLYWEWEHHLNYNLPMLELKTFDK